VGARFNGHRSVSCAAERKPSGETAWEKGGGGGSIKKKGREPAKCKGGKKDFEPIKLSVRSKGREKNM